MTTPCGHNSPAETYDANGWKRWCGECGAPLNFTEREPWTRGEIGLVLLAVVAATVGALGWFWIIFR